MDDDILHRFGFTESEIRRAERRAKRGRPGKSTIGQFIGFTLVGMVTMIAGATLAYVLVVVLHALIGAL